MIIFTNGERDRQVILLCIKWQQRPGFVLANVGSLTEGTLRSSSFKCGHISIFISEYFGIKLYRFFVGFFFETPFLCVSPTVLELFL